MELPELIESIDIVEYISQFVNLEQRGDEFWALSPFKSEKTPSFSVRPIPPCFFDYSSGIGGNVYTFVRYYFHCGSSEAIEILRKYVGDTDGEHKHREKMAAAKVCKRFQPPKTRQKESKAHILPPDYMERYEKRLDKLAVWEREGISRESLDKFQVFYDGFSNRLVYPIRDIDGNIVNVGGRTLDPDWKEKNLRKYTYFQNWNGGMQVVYGLYENLEYIKNEKELIIFEGCKSVLIADTWGVHNTVALLTSHCNPSQMKLLIGICSKYGCHIVFALDKDVDIKTDRNIAKIKRYVNVWYLDDNDNLLAAKDSPVDKGKDVFELLLSKRRRYT